ncbi:MAG: hypothetical protein OXE17_04610 [Chloroflexi bacterium]|nr:hypothetical protein [Chloroflexota bacterium]
MAEGRMLAGLTAGAAAAVVAVLVSLPLRSPSDTLLNSASVALAGLLAGALAGLLWLALRGSGRPALWFLAAWSAIVLPASAIVLVLGQSQLDGFVSFALPLAIIVYLVTGLLTVAIARKLPDFRWWYAMAAIGIALAAGFGLVTQSDQESGRLELPPPGSHSLPAEASRDFGA